MDKFEPMRSVDNQSMYFRVEPMQKSHVIDISIDKWSGCQCEGNWPMFRHVSHRGRRKSPPYKTIIMLRVISLQLCKSIIVYPLIVHLYSGKLLFGYNYQENVSYSSLSKQCCISIIQILYKMRINTIRNKSFKFYEICVSFALKPVSVGHHVRKMIMV